MVYILDRIMSKLTTLTCKFKEIQSHVGQLVQRRQQTPLSINKFINGYIKDGKIYIESQLPIVFKSQTDVEILAQNIHLDSNTNNNGCIYLNSGQGSELKYVKNIVKER